MSSETATPEPALAVPTRRRRFRFGLRGLIVMVTLTAIVFAPFGMIARRKQREQRAIQALMQWGAFAYAPLSDGHSARGDLSWVVAFRMPGANAEILVGARRIVAEGGENFAFRELTDDDMPEVAHALADLNRLTSLTIESSELTDSGLAKLQSLPCLDVLDLRCPLVTSRGTDALQQKFPKLVILDD